MAFKLFSQAKHIDKFLKIFSAPNCSRSSLRGIHQSVCDQRKVAFNLSDIGEGIREVVVKEWFVREGDVVQQFDNLCEVQSDKASVTITSRYDGTILKLHHKVDEVALVGKPLIDFDADDDEAESAKDENEHKGASDSKIERAANDKIGKVASGDAGGDLKQRKIVITTPAVRRIAYERNVDLKKVSGSGPDGRVLKSDVLEHLNDIPRAASVPRPATCDAASSEVRVEKLKGVQKAMFTMMTASLRIPHFSYCDEINVTNLIAVRNDLKRIAESLGVKLTFTPFFIKAASLALAKYPILNSSLDEQNESIVYKPFHNISIAMATPAGLVVPNIKNCERKTVLDIAKDLACLHERGKKGQLSPDDFANGTFSLSNIGVVGGTYTKPVIAPPQVAIGALGTTQIVPRFDANDSVVKAHIINVSWSADHRAIDGVTMAGFSNEWKSYIEHPHRFILQ